MDNTIDIIGAGLAGCEAALTAASFGVKVNLYEMKPAQKTPAHSLDTYCELVCSNSLKSVEPANAHGLLKQELLYLKSFLIKTAFENSIPAGKALAVDRIKFSEIITEQIKNNSMINVINQEVKEISNNNITIIAAGPLITDELFNELAAYVSQDNLFFYDAIAPVVFADSVDFNKAVFADRYGKGDGKSYLNCFMNKEEYTDFYNSLVSAEKCDPEDFEKNHFFQGCMPVEEIASKGFDSLRFGCMKPVGFYYENGKRPFAVVQLRRENSEGSIYNLVGFQTRLKYGEQERVFRKIPGLENAEFARKGSMHRNSYINSPLSLTKNLNLKNNSRIFVAGQLSGVEGYVESIATGLISAVNAVRIIKNKNMIDLPDTTMIKSLINYITNPENAQNFQPMNANFGIIPEPEHRIKNKKDRYDYYYKRSMQSLRIDN